MNKANDDWRGGFGTLRVPFEHKSIVLGFLGVMIFLGGTYGLDVLLKSTKPALEEKEGESENVATERYVREQKEERPFEPTAVEVFLWRNFISAKSGEIISNDVDETFEPDTGYLTFGSPFSFWESFRRSPWYLQLSVFLWFLVIWAFVGGAITRITAMRIAKDESLSFREAFGYVWHNKISFLVTPLAVALVMFFFVLCNMLAGLVGMLPVAGPLLYIPLYFLVLLSTLFIVLMGIGLVFGFHMLSSSISTEGGDGLQAVINVFTYVYMRPWQYILYSGLIVVSVVFLFSVGNLFIDISLDTALTESAEGYAFHYEKDEDDPYMIQIKYPDKDEPNTFYVDEDDKKYSDARKSWEERKAELNKKLKEQEEQELKELAKETREAIEKHEEEEPKIFSADLDQARDYVEGTLVVDIRPDDEDGPDQRSMSFSDIPDFSVMVCAVFLWVVVGFLKLFVLGYASSYVLAGSTTMYFLLRKEVDGTDFEEIVEKEEALEFGEQVFDEKAAAGAAKGDAKKDEKKDEKDAKKDEKSDDEKDEKSDDKKSDDEKDEKSDDEKDEKSDDEKDEKSDDKKDEKSDDDKDDDKKDDDKK